MNAIQQTDADLAPVAPLPGASLEAVLRHQESLWQRGHRPTVDELLAEHPALRHDAEARLEVIYNEVILREESGESPSLREYQARFADLAAELEIQWQVDGLLSSRRSSRQVKQSPDPFTTGVLTEAKRIGRYEIQGVLGKGGMGVAYRVFDTQLKRVVALKMLRAEDAEEHELARFRLEAEAIAGVRHPNIVQVFDVGDHQGRPFFAMEFCPGGSLAERLNGTPLPASEAARVIEQVARGVAAAHKQNIVHRDLKPANVLLAESTDAKSKVSSTALSDTKRPSGSSSGAEATAAQYKVTDFGLAKKLDAEQAQTSTGAVMGTPVYMAPEQAFGDTKRVGPAADVYSLGAILYECLTGRPPFKGATIPDTLDLVRHREPVPVRQLQPKTPRDLETICHKCLQKDPAKRYATAQELADDLGRFLDCRPIMARRLGLAGRVWRWCKRNTVFAILLAAMFGTLSAGIVSTSLALLQAWRNEAKAIQKQQEALEALEDEFRAVDTAFTKVSQDKLLEQPGMLELRRELVSASMPFYQDFVAKRQHDPRWRRQLAVAASRLGSIHYTLGAYPEAIAEYERSVQLYQRLREEHGEVDDADKEASNQLHIGQCYRAQGKLDEAEAAYARSHTLFEKLKNSEFACAEILHYRADVALTRGNFQRCLELARESEQQLRKILQTRSSDAQVLFELIGTHMTAGVCFEQMNKGPEALRELEAAEKATQEQLALRTRLQVLHRSRIAQVRGTQGRLYTRMGKPKQAEPHLRAADVEFSQLREDYPTVAGYAMNWVTNRHQLVNCRFQLGDLAEAEKMNQDAIRELQRLRRNRPQEWRYYSELLNAYISAVRIAKAQGAPERALDIHHKRLALVREWLADHPNDSQTKTNIALVAGGIAQTLTQMNRHAESLEYWDLCLQYGGAPNSTLIRAYRAAARAIVGDWRRAEEDLSAVLKMKRPLSDGAEEFAQGSARAAMAESVAKDESLPSEERDAKSKEWTKAALDLLQQAKQRGHQKLAFHVHQWKTERALDGLRKLPEFAAMLPK